MNKPKQTKSDAADNLRKVKFELEAKPGAKVYVAGTFNGWDPKQNRLRFSKSSGKYSTSIALEPGAYEYKFMIDDEWLIDPHCENWVSNQYDTLNSVLVVE